MPISGDMRPANWQAALQKLKAGNDRFRAALQAHPHQSSSWRASLAAEQKPFALVLGCSDSRVPPELIFDQGLGDLFVLRVAGNILDDVVLGSVEYAARHLDVELVVVLGHGNCGGITAALQGSATEGHLPVIAAAIEPALAAGRAAGTIPLGDDAAAVDQAARANARHVAMELAAAEPLLSGLTATGKFMVLAAYYDLDTGGVEWL